MRIAAGPVLLLVALTYGGPSAQAQQPLTIVERDQNGREAPIGRGGVVDINSVLEIRIDRDSLRARALALTGGQGAPEELLARLRVLAAVPDTALSVIAPAMKRWLSSDKGKDAQDSLLSDLRGLTGAAGRIVAVAQEGTPFRQRLNDAFNASFGTPRGLYSTLLEATAEEVRALREELDTVAAAGGIYFQLGAWLDGRDGTRPVHLAGFDEFPEAQAVDIDRFGIKAIALSDGQQRELKRIGERASAINRRGLTGVLEGFQSTLADAAVPILSSAASCATDLTDELENVATALPDSLLELAARYRSVAASARQFSERLAAARQRYGSTGQRFASGAALLEASNDDLVGIYGAGERTLQELQATTVLLAQLPAQARTQLSVAVQTIGAGATRCRTELQNALTRAKGLVDRPLELLTGVRRASDEVVDFTEEVRRLSLEAVPATVLLPLRTAGAREDGDRLRFRAAMGRREGSREDLQSVTLSMFRVLSHLVTTVGIVFADPLGSTAVEHRFQAAPSYSILLKRGSRRSVMRNRFGLIGIGLNIAAPDFDHDDVPELAAGPVVSALGDLLQLGGGYNIGQDQVYWFFGLRLPTPSLGLGGGADGETED